MLGISMCPGKKVKGGPPTTLHLEMKKFEIFLPSRRKVARKEIPTAGHRRHTSGGLVAGWFVRGA